MGTTLISLGILSTAVGLYKDDPHNPSRLWMWTTIGGFCIVCWGFIIGFATGEF